MHFGISALAFEFHRCLEIDGSKAPSVTPDPMAIYQAGRPLVPEWLLMIKGLRFRVCQVSGEHTCLRRTERGTGAMNAPS